MKLIGVIAFLALVFVGCQKEDIRPNTPVQQLRSTGDGGVESTFGDEETGNPDEGTPDGGGITDPNDANKGSRPLKPRH